MTGIRTRVDVWAGLAAAVAVLAVLGAWTRVAADAATELFISEYIEGSSNNKAIEIYNGTGAPVDLAAAGYSIQMFFNGSASAGLNINLVGTVADGDVFVLAHSSANAAILAQADQQNGSGWFNGDDAVVLRRGAAIVDVVGQIGVDPGTEWGSGLASTADNTLRRHTAVCAGYTDGADAFDPSGEWDGFATDTTSGLGSHTATCEAVPDEAPRVISTVPAHGASDVSGAVTLSVTFSEPVVAAPAAFGLSCNGTERAFALGGGPTIYTLDPVADIGIGEQCALTVRAAGVSDVDADDPPDSMVDDVVAQFRTADVCSLPYTPIPAIQGSGAAAAITGPVETKGVVVGDFELPSGSGQLRGFFVQDPVGDGDAATSDGIFVFTGGSNAVAIGDLVRVAGTAGEFQEQTQINATAVVPCGSGSVAPVDVTLPRANADDLEPYEGMLVRLPQTLTVTEHFQLGRFGQVVVSSDGRLRQPTDVAGPGLDALALQAANDLRRLIIDDDTNVQNPDPIVYGRNGQPLSAANTLRGGDTVTGAVGVLTYTWAGNAASGNAYRLRPVGALNGAAQFVAANPRPAIPLARAGRLRVAGMNVLNFFNTFGAACTSGVGGPPTDCRGAGNQAEFDRQWPKTVAAILGTQADIVGLLEIENDGYGPASALQFLVARLNEAAGAGSYAFVDADAATGRLNALGDDAIKVALVYKPAKVAPVGAAAVLDTVAFVTGGDSGPRNRPSLAQAFAEVGTGSRFVVDVNHFKSKGSACDAPDAGDGQGHCNAVRVAAAEALAAWLAADPTGSGDADVLILGDLNAYRMEDPVATLASAGYTNLVPAFHPDSVSYAFDGQWGSLDHALASATLRPQVADADDWPINADEPGVLDYNTDFKSPGQLVGLYAADAFRMSDHNPVVVDLNLIVPATRCDVDGDADIDMADLTAVRNAFGQRASGPDDPRDGNGDGLISINDLRYCQLRLAAAAIRINEVESNGGVPGDWVELYNTGTQALDLTGWRILDNDDSHVAQPLPAGTVIAAGGYLIVEEATLGFGLGAADSVRLFNAGGTLVETYNWAAHAPTTYGRCPDGTGAFQVTSAPTKNAANDCSAVIHLNEVESNGGVPGDWIELFNPGPGSANLQGFVVKDNDDTHAFTIPAGTVVPPGGYLVIEETSLGFGLGGADSVRVYDDAGGLRDSYAWAQHAATTYGRCPNGSGAFTTTNAPTKGGANACAGSIDTVRINEVESSGGVPGDWVELYNGGAEPVDVSGLVFRDGNDANGYTIPAGTTIAAGGFHVLEEGAFGFGLGAEDSARLFDASGTLLDSYSWSAHASTTYGRCPDGTGAFTTTVEPTKGAANACAGGGGTSAWPGGTAVQFADAANTFGSNMSGLMYEGSGSSAPGVLWAVRNGPGGLFRLVWNGSIWVPDTANDWANGKALLYPDGSGNPDAEGVTFAENGSLGGIYVATERNNSASAVSRNSILEFDVVGGGASLTALREWNLTADLPAVGANLGMEAITWVPDAFLVARGFLDERTGQPYDPALYPGHGSGLFFVGLEANGLVLAYALHDDGTFARIATIGSGFSGVMELQFDRELGELWVVCDDGCSGRSAILQIDPATHQFAVARVFERPSDMPNLNNEGFAFAPLVECVADRRPAVWSDDGQTDGHALRQGTVGCTPLP